MSTRRKLRLSSIFIVIVIVVVTVDVIFIVISTSVVIFIFIFIAIIRRRHEFDLGNPLLKVCPPHVLLLFFIVADDPHFRVAVKLGHRRTYTRGNFFWQSLRANYRLLPQNGLPIEVAARVASVLGDHGLDAIEGAPPDDR
jgi:hypothetical protein